MEEFERDDNYSYRYYIEYLIIKIYPVKFRKTYLTGMRPQFFVSQKYLLQLFFSLFYFTYCMVFKKYHFLGFLT
jgi:hypothetical protein